jgi:hypothetical protein
MERICSGVMAVVGVMSMRSHAVFTGLLNRRPGDQENSVFESPDLLISCKAFFGLTNADERDDSTGDALP